MAKWVSLDYNDRSWTFHCSACGKRVYWPQATRGRKPIPRVCPYPACPWCGEKMEADDGPKDEN